MKGYWRNIMVGCTALVGLAGIGAMLLLFGSLPSKLEEGYTIHVRFDNASGLSGGSRVHLNGIDVGGVTLVEILYPPKKGVLVTAKIREDVPLPQGVTATVQGSILGGSPVLDLDMSQLAGKAQAAPATGPGSEAATAAELAKELQPVTTNGTAMLEGSAPSLMSTFEGPILSRLDDMRSEFKKLADAWTKVGQNIDHLTQEASPSDVDAGKARASLDSVVTLTYQRLKDMKTTLAGLDKWVNDAELRKNVQQTMANARNLSDKLDKSIDNIDKTVQASRESIQDLAKRYVAVADDLSAAVTSAQKAIDEARTGNGTVGKLLHDPALYNNMVDAVQRVDQSMTEFKILVEKFEKEGISVQMGGSGD